MKTKSKVTPVPGGVGLQSPTQAFMKPVWRIYELHRGSEARPGWLHETCLEKQKKKKKKVKSKNAKTLFLTG